MISEKLQKMSVLNVSLAAEALLRTFLSDPSIAINANGKTWKEYKIVIPSISITSLRL